jgi:hypothetical protein
MNAGVTVDEEGEVEYTLDSFIKDTTGFIAASKVTDYLAMFFEIFWSDKILNVEKRIPLFKKFVDEKIFTK